MTYYFLVSVENKTKILIASHSTQQTISERLQQGLLEQGVFCYLLNENTPHSLSARANAIQWCDVFIVISSRLYQRTYFCMEALKYAKDRQKTIVAILGERSFRPYGALGCISASALRSIVINDDTGFEHVMSQIINSACTDLTKVRDDSRFMHPSQVKIEFYEQQY